MPIASSAAPPADRSAGRRVGSAAGAAVGRADLLWWLARCGEADVPDALDRVAALLGLERQPAAPLTLQLELPALQVDGRVDAGATPEPDPPPVQPRAPFLFVTRILRDPEALPGRPADGPHCLRGVEPLAQEEMAAPRDVPPPPVLPLVPWPRLWPFLRQALGGRQPGAADLPRLLHRLARGEALPRYLPRRLRHHWAAQAVVLIDYDPSLWPFWQDFNRLVAALRPLRGELGLQVIALYDGPGRDGQAWGEEHPSPLPWPATLPGRPLLVLSDLGLLQAPDHVRRQGWQSALSVWRAAGGRPQVLAPLGPGQIDPDMAALADIVCFSPDASLRRRAAQPSPDGAAPEQRAADAVRTALACAIRIEFDLLRAAVREFAPPALQAGVEAAFWQHPDMVITAAGGYIRPDAAHAWQAGFAALPPAQQGASFRLMRARHADCLPVVRHEECVLWASLAQGEALQAEAAQVAASADFMLRFAAHYHRAADSLGGLQRAYAQRNLARSNAALRRTRPYLNVLYAQAHRDDLLAGESPLDLDGLDTAEVMRTLPPPEGAPREAALVQRGRALTLEPVQPPYRVGMTPPGAALATVPLGSAVLMMHTLTTRAADPATAPVVRKLGHLPCPLLLMSDDLRSLRIDTGAARVDIDVLPRPDWACRIERGQAGLMAWVRWLGREHALRWLPADDEGRGRWQSDSPQVGWDGFGLYAEFAVKRVVQRCRWIPSGRFVMGSPEDEPERSDDELLHPVVLSRGYWLADTACTQALWQAVTGKNPSHLKGDAQAPVVGVSWEDVQSFLGGLNRRVPGLDAGLPTEAQWEYACRAGTKTPFSFGAQITPEQVNYDGKQPYAGGETGEYRARTVAVKSLPPNGWGLYEMHGNVWEWCADAYGEYGSEEHTDPAGPARGQLLVMRGGSWAADAGNCRSAVRDLSWPDERFSNVGFRLAPGQAVSQADESLPGLSGQGGAERRAGQDSPGNDGGGTGGALKGLRRASGRRVGGKKK